MIKIINDLKTIIRKDKKTRVFVLNASGGPNFGDETIMEILVTRLYSINHDIEIVSIRKPKTYIRVNKDDALVKVFKSNSSLIRELASMMGIIRSDFVIMGGGGLLQDYGLEKISKQQIEARLRLLQFSRFFGKKVILLGIGAGPIKTKRGKLLVKKVLNKVQLITTRDQDSADLLKKLGVKTEVIPLADFVFAKNITFDKTKGSYSKKLNKKYINVGISLLPLYSILSDHIKMHLDENVLKEMMGVISFLTKKYNAKIHLIPMDVFQDEPFLLRLKKIANNPDIVISKVKNTKDINLLYSKMDIVIGSRFHSIVFSIINQIPFIAIEYHPKVNSLVNLLANKDVSIQYNSLKSDILIEKIENILKNKESIKNSLKDIYQTLKFQAEDNFRILKNFMG